MLLREATKHGLVHRLERGLGKRLEKSFMSQCWYLVCLHPLSYSQDDKTREIENQTVRDDVFEVERRLVERGVIKYIEN